MSFGKEAARLHAKCFCQFIMIIRRLTPAFVSICLSKGALSSRIRLWKLFFLFTKQLLTYLKLKKCRLGFLLNWNVPLMKDGIKRMVNNL